MSSQNSSSVVSMAKALTPSLSIGESGVASLPKDAFATSLPEGRTEAQIKADQKHRDEFVAAATLALKDTGFDFLKANPGAKEVSLKVNVGSDVATIRIQRERTGRNPQTGEATSTHGAVGLSFKVSARPNRGELKKVCDSIKEQYAGLKD